MRFSKNGVCAFLLLAGFCSAHAQTFSGSLLDAVFLTLQSNDGVAASKQQLSASQGAVLSARAPFDPVWSAGVSQQQNFLPLLTAAGGGDFLTRQKSFKTGVNRLLESGVAINPSLTVDRIRDSALNANGSSRSNLAVNFVIPLLKGRGTDINTAPVASAELSRDAAYEAYRHTMAAAVARTTTSYWDWLAARQTLEQFDAAALRAQQELDIARKLAAAGEIPRADLLKYDSRKLARETARVRSEQQVRSAAQALALAMNAPLEAITGAPVVLDAFPLAASANLALLDNSAAINQILAGSTDQRLDLKAAELRLRAAKVLADATSRDSAKQLDLNISLGYSGLTEGRTTLSALSAFGNPSRGPNMSVTLNYVLPSGELELRGRITQREAAAELARIEEQALRLRITGEALTQLNALRSAISQLEKAAEQLRLQTIIYNNEKRSYPAGLATLLDLFTSESQLNAAQIEWVEAQRNFAQALVLFRLQTGRLLSNDRLGGQINTATLTSLPNVAELAAELDGSKASLPAYGQTIAK